MGLLTCTRCRAEKPADSEHFPLHNRKKNGLDSWCRACRATYRNEIARGRFRETATDDEVRALRQISECVICGDAPAPGRSLAIDHDHQTGVIRGALCSRCNLGLGHFRDDPELLEFARIYLLSSVGNPEADAYLTQRTEKC